MLLRTLGVLILFTGVAAAQTAPAERAPRNANRDLRTADRTRDAAVRYLQQRGYAFPCAWVTPDIQRAMPKPKGLPITLARGRDGRLLMAERGQLFAEDIDAIAQWL